MTEKIWASTIGDPFKLDLFDCHTLHRIEKKLHVKLPQDYIDLMKSRNGGTLARAIFQLEEEEISIDHLLGIGESEEEGILITLYMCEEWDLPKEIVLLSGDGHSWVFLDYRMNRDNPTVSYINTETEVDVVLASDFTNFISKLTFDQSIDDSAYVSENIYSEKAFERIVQQGDDPFALTDGVLYFTEIDCDMAWLFSQVKLIMAIDTEESEFILPEVLYFLIKKLPFVTLTINEQEALHSLANHVKTHQLSAVRKYYKEIRHYVK